MLAKASTPLASYCLAALLLVLLPACHRPAILETKPIGALPAGLPFSTVRWVPSPDNSHLAVAVPESVDGFPAWRVFLDGQPGPRFHRVVLESLRFSLDGQHLTYLTEYADRFGVVLDHRPLPQFDSAGCPGPFPGCHGSA